MTVDVRAILDTLIQKSGDDYASLSRLLGRNPTYIQQFIKRGVPRRLSEEDRRMLARHFGVSEKQLGGPDDGEARAVRNIGAQASGEDDYILVPYYNLGASAGPGAVAVDQAPEAAMAFQARWARRISSGGVQSLSVIRVEGDSMFPTLSHGDHILVDMNDRRVRDGIYVLRTEDNLHVKRLSISPTTGHLSIRSDNAAYASWKDCAPDAVDVIGRVVWVGRKL